MADTPQSRNEQSALTPMESTFPEKVRSNAQFLRDCYANLSQAEAEVIAKKLDECAVMADEFGRLMDERFFTRSETRPSEDAKDAARYRWLRIHGAALAGSEHFKQELVRRCINLDEEIDAAMEKSNVLR